MRLNNWTEEIGTNSSQKEFNGIGGIHQEIERAQEVYEHSILDQAYGEEEDEAETPNALIENTDDQL